MGEPAPLELPVEGFPPSAEEISRWFRDRYGRDPGSEELTGIINAMAARDATPPVEPDVLGDPPPGAGLISTSAR